MAESSVRTRRRVLPQVGEVSLVIEKGESA
jgi:hypothetical protein